MNIEPLTTAKTTAARAGAGTRFGRHSFPADRPACLRSGASRLIGALSRDLAQSSRLSRLEAGCGIARCLWGVGARGFDAFGIGRDAIRWETVSAAPLRSPSRSRMATGWRSSCFATWRRVFPRKGKQAFRRHGCQLVR